MPKKPSPNRRKSIAVPNQNLPSIVPKGRRRAHSIVPGAKLSPLAKARRSLAPRKSILKASLNALNIDSQSQQSATQSQSFVQDDATCSMDFTEDFTAPVYDNTSRKSFGRRVSFAMESEVRFFPKTKRRRSPGSLPPGSESFDQNPNTQVMSNENDYPGKRRSSVRYSIAGSEDMDMTSIAPGAFQARGSAILDEELDYDDEESYEEDMDVTQAIHGGFARKRSLSSGGRRPLSQLQSPSTNDSDDPNESRSDVGDESFQSDQSQIMDFTIPLGQSLRPAEKDEAWLALKKVTHSGNDPSEPEPSSDDMAHQHGDDDMNLDDAMARLKRARDSMSLSQTQEAHEDHDDTFSSTENSFEDEFDANKTLNLSRVLGRPSLGASRMSMGYQDSNMDESEVYGNIVAATQPTPRQSLAPQSRPSEPLQSPKPSIFQPPATQKNQLDAEPLTTQSAKPTTTTSSTAAFAFTSRSPSPTKSSNTPSKTKPKLTFSAAFAPPVARLSPKKPESSSTSRTSLAKRPRPSNQDENDTDLDKPSPAKRQALAGKWLGVSEPANEESPTPTPVAKTAPKPKPLSPSKKAPFQSSGTAPAGSTSRPSSALRRPSGYFAKRKSLAVSFSVPPANEPTSSDRVPSPKKKSGIGIGRASIGSGASDAWARFNKAAGSGMSEKALGKQKSSDKEAETEACVRESARQASASPSPTRGSPAPAQRQPIQNFQQDERSPSPKIPSLADANDDAPEIQYTDDHSGNMEIDVDATRQWREGVEPAKYDEEDDTPAISVAQFFSMTGIKFMDEVTAPRRSIHPSQQPIRHPRNFADIPLAEYVTAMAIDIPQLDLYSRVSKDLEAWMAKSEIVFAQAEEEAAKLTPELFVEYARADEEGQAELLHQLKLIRTHTRYLARSDWYDWKLQWVEGLRVTADDAFASLENDARALEEPKTLIANVIPELEREYEELMRELEKERAEVTEIEAGDQDYLNELKATIAEQNIEIEALKAELSEGTDQVRWLQERMDEIEVQKREAKNTINTAERVLRMKQTSTRSEVFRLKGELEALEDLHMFRITKVNSNLFEYVYSSLFQVSIPCKNFMPIVTKVNITYHGKPNSRYKDDFPRLSAFFLTSANQHITEGDDLTVREIVHRLSDYWSACAQLRTQLTLLSIKYPVDIVIPSRPKDSPPTFHARAMVMFPSVMGKAFISFVLPFSTFGQWPMSIDSLDCDVEVAYGPLDRSTIMQAVVSRLSQASPSDNYACFLDACIEAQDVYH